MSQLMDALKKAEKERIDKERGQRKNAYENIFDDSLKVKRNYKGLKIFLAFLLITLTLLFGYFKFSFLKSDSEVQAIAKKESEKTKNINETVATKDSKTGSKVDELQINKPDKPQPEKLEKLVNINKNISSAPVNKEAKSKTESKDTVTHLKNKQKNDSKLVDLTSKSDGLVDLANKTNKKSKNKTSNTKTTTVKKSQREVKPAWKTNLVINAIVYSDAVNDRFALVNGRKVFAGNIVPNTDYKVVSILKDGIIVNDGSGELFISSF